MHLKCSISRNSTNSRNLRLILFFMPGPQNKDISSNYGFFTDILCNFMPKRVHVFHMYVYLCVSVYLCVRVCVCVCLMFIFIKGTGTLIIKYITVINLNIFFRFFLKD